MQTGRIFQLNTSPGGVPKLPQRSVRLGELGLDGDGHRDKQNQGGPERALCLFSLEQILALQEEGHQIFPGSTGENVTTVGIDLSALEPGTVLRLGEAEVEVTGFASPCKTVEGSFEDGGFKRISHKVNPGWSRLYARVLRGGELAIGQPVEVVTPAPAP